MKTQKKEDVLFFKERYYDDSDFENLESFYFKIEEAVMNDKNIANSNKQDLKNIIYAEIYNTLSDYDLDYDFFEESLRKTAIDYVDLLDKDQEKEFKTQLIGFLSEEGWDKELNEKDLNELIECLNENQEISITYDNGTERILNTTFHATIVARTYNEANSDLSYIGDFLESDFRELFNIETTQERRNEIFEDLKENYQNELNNGFIKFLNSQGLNLEILKDLNKFKDFYNKHPSFINDVIVEIDNVYTKEMNAMTYLVEIPFSEAIMINTAHNLIDKLGGILPKEEREKSWLNDFYIKMPKNTMCGLYNPVNGSGSLIEIYSIEEMEMKAKNAVVLVRTKYPKESNFWWCEVDYAYNLSSSAYEHGKGEVSVIEKSSQLNLSIEEELIKKQENKQQLKI